MKEKENQENRSQSLEQGYERWNAFPSFFINHPPTPNAQTPVRKTTEICRGYLKLHQKNEHLSPYKTLIQWY